MATENLITVKSKLPKQKDESWPLAVYERDAAHPGGEIYVKGDREYEVAPTAAVVAAIQRGALEVISGDAPKDASALLAASATNKGEGLPPAPPATGGPAPAGAPVNSTPLPDDFPHRDVLASKGITSVEQLKNMSSDQVNALGLSDDEKRDIANALRTI